MRFARCSVFVVSAALAVRTCNDYVFPGLSLSLSIYIYIYTHMNIYIYIYIYLRYTIHTHIRVTSIVTRCYCCYHCVRLPYWTASSRPLALIAAPRLRGSPVGHFTGRK